MYYKLFGDKCNPPLVLLHGNGEDHTVFSKQIPILKNKFYLIAIDTRGHGKSERGDAPFDFFTFARDTIDVLDELGIEKADFLGFSDGGNIAMHIGFTYPNRVGKLILNGSNTNPGGVKRGFQFPIELSYKLLKKGEKKHPKLKSKAEIIGLMVLEPHVTEQQLNSILAPALVLVGSRDMIKSSHSKQIAAAIPNAEMKVISGSHGILVSRYKRYSQEVIRFLLQ